MASSSEGDSSSLGLDRNFPSVLSYDAWVPKEFTDDLLLDAQQPLYLTPDEERLFRSFGDGLDTDFEQSLGTNDDFLDDKQTVYAEAHAAGLFKGGIRRAAFSMGDLQALQPTVPVSQASRSPTPRAATVGTSKAPRLESVPESKALPNPPNAFRSELLMEPILSERHNTGMLGHLALEQMPSDLEGPGVDSRFGSAQNMGFFGDNDAMVADLSHMDLAVSQGRIKSEPGVFPSNNSMEFSGGLDGFDPKLSFSSGFGDLTQLPGSEPVDSMFDIPYMDVTMEESEKRPPLAPKSPSKKLPPTSSMPTLDGGIMASSQQTFKEIPKSSQGGPLSARPSSNTSETNLKPQQKSDKPSRTSKPLHRSQSALELRSMSRQLPSHGSTGELQKPRFTVELTTPEGHTYTAGRLSNEERAQKILRYRQKRHERNFNKRIKYMCRKTLADSRPRVRGRFARNDDAAAVMPHETKKALAEKAKKERKAAEAAAAEYLRAQDRLHGRFPPTFQPIHPSMPTPNFIDPSLSAALDFKSSRKLTSDLSDLIPTSIPHVDSDPNLSTGTAFNFPQLPYNSLPLGDQKHRNHPMQ